MFYARLKTTKSLRSNIFKFFLDLSSDPNLSDDSYNKLFEEADVEDASAKEENTEKERVEEENIEEENTEGDI